MLTKVNSLLMIWWYGFRYMRNIVGHPRHVVVVVVGWLVYGQKAMNSTILGFLWVPLSLRTPRAGWDRPTKYNWLHDRNRIDNVDSRSVWRRWYVLKATHTRLAYNVCFVSAKCGWYEIQYVACWLLGDERRRDCGVKCRVVYIVFYLGGEGDGRKIVELYDFTDYPQRLKYA